MAYNPHFSHSPRPTGNTPLRYSDELKRKRIDDYQAKDNPFLSWNKADLINYAISLETRLASCSGTTQARSRDNISGGIIDSGWTSGGNSSQSRGGASYAPPIPPPLPPLPPPISDPDYKFINPLPPQDSSQHKHSPSKKPVPRKRFPKRIRGFVTDMKVTSVAGKLAYIFTFNHGKDVYFFPGYHDSEQIVFFGNAYNDYLTWQDYQGWVTALAGNPGTWGGIIATGLNTVMPFPLAGAVMAAEYMKPGEVFVDSHFDSTLSSLTGSTVYLPTFEKNYWGNY